MQSKTILLAAAAVVAFCLAAQAQAQQAATAPAASQGASANAAAATFTDGLVRKIDKETKKITLKHGEIRNLDMPAMTMVFAVPDAALLERVKAGDKVRFKAIESAGTLTVVDIQATP
jgi:Cu/Ag efflux protein CusF